jgi:two-component system chemotaxis sensor kinase CheA
VDIRQQLLAAFAIEYREHIDAIRAALADGEGRPPDWNDVFRRAHSLKGAARAVDLPRVEAIAHRLESLFERIAAGATALDRETTDAVHLALDRIETYASGGDEPGDEADDALTILDRRGRGDAAEPRVAPPPAAKRPTEVATSQPDPAAEASQLLRVPADAVEALTRATHELSSALGGESAVADGLARIAASARDLARRTERLRGDGASLRQKRPLKEATSAARADLREFETGLLALARDAVELSRTRAAAAAAVDAAASRVRAEAERLALVPVETAFGGFARALRDMARDEGREVDVALRGLELPVDRGTLQILKDPVLHALRNALSHGAEPPEARRRQGKPPALSISLEVAVRGGRLRIHVRDDGRGPDLAAIEAAARSRNLLAPGESADSERLLSLVFEPGFSTASTVDTLSGRGIGLAVVAEAVRKLGGTVRLAPRQPWGTSLELVLPLSAARRTMLLVEAGSTTYALPSGAVERLLRLPESSVDLVMGRRVVRLSGADGGLETLPVTELGHVIGSGAGDPDAAGMLTGVLVRAGGRRCVLAVDRLQDVRTLLVLPAPPIGADPRLIAGTVILAGDTPCLVLDPEGIIERAADGAVPAADLRSETRGTTAPARRSTILVVDDSITTRTLEKGILEAAGYRVVVCVDGQDALDRLRAGIEPVDLVVADVEMPRLDGFGLVGALRAEEAFARLPVILMTSRGDADDVARGLALGADAYLTKQTFDQRQLLDTIGQLL